MRVKAIQFNLAKTFFDQIVNDAFVKSDALTYTSMITGFVKVGMIENSRKMFDEMICEPNFITYIPRLMDIVRKVVWKMQGYFCVE